jgi:hypothetical protein
VRWGTQAHDRALFSKTASAKAGFGCKRDVVDVHREKQSKSEDSHIALQSNYRKRWDNERLRDDDDDALMMEADPARAKYLPDRWVMCWWIPASQAHVWTYMPTRRAMHASRISLVIWWGFYEMLMMIDQDFGGPFSLAGWPLQGLSVYSRNGRVKKKLFVEFRKKNSIWKKNNGNEESHLVFHHTDTHILVLYLALAFSLHNKQENESERRHTIKRSWLFLLK